MVKTHKEKKACISSKCSPGPIHSKANSIHQVFLNWDPHRFGLVWFFFLFVFFFFISKQHIDIIAWFVFYFVPFFFSNIGPKPLKLFYKPQKGLHPQLKSTTQMEITSFHMEPFVLLKHSCFIKGRGHTDLLNLALLHRAWESPSARILSIGSLEGFRRYLNLLELDAKLCAWTYPHLHKERFCGFYQFFRRVEPQKFYVLFIYLIHLIWGENHQTLQQKINK